MEDLEAGAARACPSIKTPVPAGRGWVVVGRNPSFDWRLPILNEPVWAGHHYVLELTREPITRAVRKAAAVSMTEMEKALRRSRAWSATISSPRAAGGLDDSSGGFGSNRRVAATRAASGRSLVGQHPAAVQPHALERL